MSPVLECGKDTLWQGGRTGGSEMLSLCLRSNQKCFFGMACYCSTNKNICTVFFLLNLFVIACILCLMCVFLLCSCDTVLSCWSDPWGQSEEKDSFDKEGFFFKLSPDWNHRNGTLRTKQEVALLILSWLRHRNWWAVAYYWTLLRVAFFFKNQDIKKH